MSLIEIIAVVFTFISVWLSIKKNKLLWPIGIIGIAAYMYLFYGVRLYADFGLQIIYILQSLYGWYYWKGKNKIEPPITKLKPGEIATYLCLFIGSVYLLTLFLMNYTNAALPFFDAICSVGSLIGNYLLAKKKIENWGWWIFVDIIYVGVFSYKQLYLSAALYALFFAMAIKGYIEWGKAVKEE